MPVSNRKTRLPTLRFRFDPCGERLAHPAPARLLARVHALDFGVIVAEGHATASRRLAVQPGDEETHIGLEQLLSRQGVALIGFASHAEDPISSASSSFASGVATETRSMTILTSPVLMHPFEHRRDALADADA